MKRIAYFFGVILWGFLFLAGSLFADILVLKDGRILEGKVISDDGKEVVFQMRKANMLIKLHLKKKEILKLQKSKSTYERLMENYENKLKAAYKASSVTVWDDLVKWCRKYQLHEEAKKALQESYLLRKTLVQKVNTAEGWYKLAVWAEEKKILPSKEIKKLFEKVIQLDPNHKEARKKLGYVYYKNKWISYWDYEELYDKEMRLKGYVKYKGDWYRPEALKVMLKIREMDKIKDLKKKLQNLEEENRSLRSKIKGLSQRVLILENKRDNLKQEISQLRKEFYASNYYWKQQIIQLQQAINDLYRKIGESHK